MTAYKQTELGLIPSDWEVRKIGDFAPLQRGFDLPNSQLKNGDYPVVYSNGIGNFHNEFKIKAPCVVTGRSGTLGKIHYIEKNFWAHNTTLWVTKFNNCIPKFVYFLFQKISFERFASGSGVPTLNRNDAHEFKTILPKSTAEQTAIATALSDTDALLAELEKLLAKKQAIKTATMQQLLTGKTRLPEFAHRADGTPKGSLKTEWGNIPEDWEVVALGEYVNIFDNQRIPVSASNRIFGNIPYYGANGIQDYVNGFTHDGEFVLVAEDGANDLINYPVQYTTGKIWVNNHAHVLQGKKNILCNKFLAYCISSMNISHYLVGGTRAKLNGSTLKQIEILCPQYKEQTAIAQILGDMDSEIKALQARIEKLREIKQGMMQNLLTGKIRLPF